MGLHVNCIALAIVPSGGLPIDPFLGPQKRLRFVDVLPELPNGDAEAATELAMPSRGFTEAESLESCRNLRKARAQ